MTVPSTPNPIQPDPAGQLSNTRGSNTGGDALPQKWRYSNDRGSADPAGQVQFAATRLTSEAGGAAQTPSTAWRSGWLGAPTLTALPQGMRFSGVAEINQRIYVCGGYDGTTIYSTVWSAALNGGSIGTWRAERPMAVQWPLGSSQFGLSPRYGMGCTCATFGASGGSGSLGQGIGGTSWLIVYGGITPAGVVGSMIAATINPDGTLGPWQTILLNSGLLAFAQLTAVPNQYVTSALVLTGGSNSSTTGSAGCWATAIRNAPPNSNTWDVPVGFWWTALPALPFWVSSHFTAYDWPNGRLLVIKGNDGTTNWVGMYQLVFGVDYVNWVISPIGGSWTTIGQSGGVVQNGAGGFYAQPPRSGPQTPANPQSFVYLFGGSSAVGLWPAAASAITTVQIGAITWDTSSNATTVAWSSSAFPLPAAAVGPGVALGTRLGTENLGWGPYTDANTARIYALGGGNGGTGGLSTVRSSSTPNYNTGGQITGSDITAWLSGIGAGLASGDLGTGGSIAASTDPNAPAGSQDVTVNYGGVTTPTIAAFADGDLVQLGVQFTDKLGGDPSAARFTLERIGQPPTVTNIVLSSTASGQPTVSWAFNSGLGGGKQATWRVVITRNGDSHVVFDSGVRYGQANSVQCQCAPMLVTATAYTATVTVTSTDSPVSGSSATGTNTLAINQTLGTTPVTPTGLSLAFDSVNKWLLLSGTAAVNTTAVRIYYRDTLLAGNFRLYAEVTQAPGAFAYKLMDKLSLGRSFDFRVSALGGAAANESAQSTTFASTIPADLESPSGYLHLAGQPLTGALGTAVKGTAWSELSAEMASKTLRRYNAKRALVVQGKADFRHLALEVFSAYSASNTTLATLRDNLLAGGVVWWRDRNGVTLPMGLESPSAVRTSYPNHRDFTMQLVQVDDLYSPYLTMGLADGIPTLDSGSIPALNDPLEQVI